MKHSHPHKNPPAAGIGKALLLIAASAVLPSSILLANGWEGTNGTGGNGSFGTGTNWTLGATPGGTNGSSQNDAGFYIDNTLTTAVSTVDFFSTARSIYRIQVGSGKSVTFTLNNTVTLNSGTASVFGANILNQTGTGASHTVFRQQTATSTGTINSGMIYVGDTADGDGHSLTFSGENLTINDNSTLSSLVGRQGKNSLLTIADGAKFHRFALAVASNQSFEGNRIVLTGAGSQITVARALGIGSLAYTAGGTSQQIYDNAARGNHMRIENSGSSLSNGLNVGAAENARSNYVSVQNASSVLQLSDESQMQIGAANSLGGNYVTVSDGGTIKVSGITAINSHSENNGLNDGANRLTIGNGGTFTSESMIKVGGLLQLAQGGTLIGQTTSGSSATLAVNVENNGRFETAGSGLGSTVTTSVANGGTVSIGLHDASTGLRSGAEVLNLSSTMDFSAGGSLEISIFSSTSIDQIDFDADGILDGVVTLNLLLSGYTPNVGDSWTLFMGESSGISASFDLSNLDSAWDTSLFNEAGGWRISVVPEPQTWMLLGLGFGAILLSLRRRSLQRLF